MMLQRRAPGRSERQTHETARAASLVSLLCVSLLWPTAWPQAQEAEAPPATATLEVVVTGVADARGELIVTLYDSAESFLEQSLAKRFVPAAADGDVLARFEDLAPGFYAVTIVHDRNRNGELDRGLFGVPRERYAFSTGYRPRFRAPRFDEVQFEVRAPLTRIEIALP